MVSVYPQQSVPTLRYTRKHSASAVPRISKDRLLLVSVNLTAWLALYSCIYIDLIVLPGSFRQDDDENGSGSSGNHNSNVTVPFWLELAFYDPPKCLCYKNVFL